MTELSCPDDASRCNALAASLGASSWADLRQIILAQGGHIERIRHIYSMGLISALTNTLAGAVMAVLLYGHVNSAFWIGWLVVSQLLSAFYLLQYYTVDVSRFRRISKKWLIHLCVFGVTINLIWMPANVAAIIYLQGTSQIVALTQFLIMITGMTIVFSAIPMLAFVCLAVALFPIGIAALASGMEAGSGMAVATVLFFIGLASFSIKFAHTIRQAETRERERQQSLDELAQAHEDIRRLAETDAVSGILNRRSFVENLTRLASEPTETGLNYGLFMIDLNHFKHVNDAFGHEIGDEFLRTIGQRLDAAVGQRALAARVGGDEFSVVSAVPMTDADLASLAQSIHGALHGPVETERGSFHSGGSIGVVLYPEHADSVPEWLTLADHSLRLAKQRQRNTVFWFDGDEKVRVLGELEMASRLEQAIHDGQVCLRYQPQICLETGLITGLEALARWSMDDTRAIAPPHFFAIAEKAGIVLDLCDAVLRRAATDALEWLALGLSVPSLSVNIHPLQLLNTARLRQGLEPLADALGGADRIVLEITEDCVIGRGTEEIPAILCALSAEGYGVSLDDFGTGFASLTHIKSLPIDQIKIDRKFIADICESEQDLRIVESIIRIARPRDITIVAEGIENSSQHELLRHAGSLVGQGFHYYRPLLAEQIPDVLRASLGEAEAIAARN